MSFFLYFVFFLFFCAKLAEKAKGIIRKKDYQKVYTFFDNDKAGEEAEKSFAELDSQIV